MTSSISIGPGWPTSCTNRYASIPIPRTSNPVPRTPVRRGGGFPRSPFRRLLLAFNPVSSLSVGGIRSLADRRPGFLLLARKHY